MKKLKIGDLVKDSREGKAFVIKIIVECEYISTCPSKYGIGVECPGSVNGWCFGGGSEYHLERLGVSNPNSKIIIKE